MSDTSVAPATSEMSETPLAQRSDAPLLLLVFIEGFVSLGAEILMLRRLLPHVGSTITVTAPTIGLFLLALALGYHSGGQVTSAYLSRVARNFACAALLVGVGLAGPVVDGVFGAVASAPLAAFVLVAGILCPVAWLLGQTVPILTNLLRHTHTGARSGTALFWSTLGSFLGSMLLSLLVMPWLGVGVAVIACAVLLLVALCWLPPPGLPKWPSLVAIATLALLANFGDSRARSETAYATYRVAPVEIPGYLAPEALWINNSLASLLDRSEPPRHTRYIERLRRLLREDLPARAHDVLVLGAGGFTLSQGDTRHRYTYVDIDPAIREIAERDYLREPAVGEFVAADARRYVATSTRKFDVVVVDVYSAGTSIPAHLVTREFWRETRAVLREDGVMAANLILDAKLASPYARNLLATIQAEYGACAIEILMPRQRLSNVLVWCQVGGEVETPALYSDERNRADIDALRGVD